MSLSYHSGAFVWKSRKFELNLTFPLSFCLSFKTKAHQKQRRDGYKLFSGKEKNKSRTHVHNSIYCIKVQVSFQTWGIPALMLCPFSWMFHASVFDFSCFPICCSLFVIMFHSSGTPAGPGKESCQMPFFSTSCWSAIPMTTAQRYINAFWFNLDQATPGPQGTKSMSLFISEVYLYSSLKLFLVSWWSMLLFVYMLLAFKTVAVAVDVSTTAENVVQYIMQQCKLLVSSPL